MLKVTDYERVSTVTPTQLGQFNCPKCIGICDEICFFKRSSRIRREFTCKKCGRCWIEVPAWVRTVSDAHKSSEDDLSQ